MKTLIATLAAVGALTAVAAPAAAQPYGYDRDSYNRDYSYNYDRYDRDYSYNRGWEGRRDWSRSERAQIAERRIERGLRNGSLTPHEAAVLRDDVRDYARLEARMSYGGLAYNERNELDIQFERLMRKITNAAHNPYYGSGYYR